MAKLHIGLVVVHVAFVVAASSQVCTVKSCCSAAAAFSKCAVPVLGEGGSSTGRCARGSLQALAWKSTDCSGTKTRICLGKPADKWKTISDNKNRGAAGHVALQGRVKNGRQEVTSCMSIFGKKACGVVTDLGPANHCCGLCDCLMPKIAKTCGFDCSRNYAACRNNKATKEKRITSQLKQHNRKGYKTWRQWKIHFEHCNGAKLRL